MLLFLSDDRKVLFLSLYHDGLAFEQTVDHQIADLSLKDVTGLVVVPLLIDGTPIVHVLHSVVDCLREGGNVVGVLEDGGNFFEIEDKAVHPDWTGEYILVVFYAVLRVVIHLTIQCLQCIGLGYVIFEDNSSEYLLPLVLRVCALIHEIEEISIDAEHTDDIGVYHLL